MQPVLTLQQKQAIKASIIAASESECQALEADPANADLAVAVKDLYNLVSSPDYWAWKTLVTESEIYEQPSVDGTFWSWTIYIARSQAEREAWGRMVSMRGGMKPSLANVRTGIADIFSGAGGAAQRTHLLIVGRRKTTRVEKLLIISGAGTTADPATMGADGMITHDEILSAMGS